jgi:hypothetical protein
MRSCGDERSDSKQKKLHNDELHNLYCSPYRPAIKVVRLRSMG